MSVAAPRAGVIARGGACFVHRGLNECLGVNWEVSLSLGLGFSWGGVRVLAGGICQKFIFVLAVSAPQADALGGVEAWVLSGCQVRGGWE